MTSPENRTGLNNKTEYLQSEIDNAERSSTVICAQGQPALDEAIVFTNNSSDEEMVEKFQENPLQSLSESANDDGLIPKNGINPFHKKPLATHL